MQTVLFIVVLFVITGIVIAALKKRGNPGSGDQPWPFYVKKPLTQPEQILYHRLAKALPERIVLAQVQLSCVLGVKKGFKSAEWNNRINRMRLDFVVCLKDSTVVAAIELDDRSHQKASGVEADAKKEKALSSAGVPLVRWQVSALPDEAAIRLAFAAQQPYLAVERVAA
ncbi:MAG: DUF2726 domain-containing protein [Burkholderiales bacterium]|nr:DUF2726 domain-containing protein [Burkholderiales bacterium]